MEKVLGIDLGTTNCCVSVMSGENIIVLENFEGRRTTPSVVSFIEESGNSKILIGEMAKRQLSTNPNTITSIKRKMGTTETVDINGNKYKPEEISAMILKHLKEYAEKKLNTKITKAVITVPAYFDNAQRIATKNAGKIAGLEVERIINEPTAAALSFGLDKKGTNQKVLVYDLGGGTFDVSILEIEDDSFIVLSTQGIKNLGGDDYDNEVINHIVEDFKKEYNIDLSTDKMALQRIKEAAENAKKELSTKLETQISLPFIVADNTGPKHIDSKIYRSNFESWTKKLSDKTIKPLKDALKEAKLDINDIDEILLVGGSTRMPHIKELIKQEMNKEPNSSINPDEVVAMGAAIQGAMLSGAINNLLLLDVTPMSLGTSIIGDIMQTIIPKNSTIPIKKTEPFTTTERNQAIIDLEIIQGERKKASMNKKLGEFELSGIEKAPMGVPKIEVTFSIDSNSILSAEAKNLFNNKTNSLTIKNTSLTKEEIKRMIKDAEKNSESDNKHKENSIIINEALSSLERMKIHFEEDNFSSDEAKEVYKNKIDSLKKLIDENEVDKIKVILKL